MKNQEPAAANTEAAERVPIRETPERGPKPGLTNEASFSGVQSKAPRQVEPAPQTQAAPSPAPQRELQDPLARVALAFVGQDPVAEGYWVDAIFDPSLPDKERDDLMEDLNEEGFADPKHPQPEDLPLIFNRLAIIEQLAPDLDEFMSLHLAEAYKDLLNMADQAIGRE